MTKPHIDLPESVYEEAADALQVAHCGVSNLRDLPDLRRQRVEKLARAAVDAAVAELGGRWEERADPTVKGRPAYQRRHLSDWFPAKEATNV